MLQQTPTLYISVFGPYPVSVIIQKEQTESCMQQNMELSVFIFD